MSRYTTIAAILLLLGLISSPLWIWSLIDRAHGFTALTKTSGQFPVVQALIDDTTGADVLFVGSSKMWASIDHTQLSKSFFELTGSSLSSATIGHNWHGADVDFLLISRYLEAHPNIELILLEPPPYAQHEPHTSSRAFLDVWSAPTSFWNLPYAIALSLYAEQMIFTPRLLFDTVDRNPKNNALVGKGIANRGSLIFERGYRGAAFAEVDGTPPQIQLRDFLITAERASVEVVSGERSSIETSLWESVFWDRIKHLAAKHDVDVAFLHIPTLTGEPDKLAVRPFELNGPFPSFGGSTSLIFPDMNLPEIQSYYDDDLHMNKNGARYWAKLVSQLLAQHQAFDRRSAKMGETH